MARILVVEDEPDIAMLLADDLRLEGHEVEVIGDGQAASERGRESGWDLIVLDVMLPKKDGFDVCRELRKAGVRTPIILLTAKSHEAEKIMGLDLGADDYVTKPFNPRELRARIRAVLRRTEGDLPETVRFGHVEVDPARSVVRVNGKDRGADRDGIQTPARVCKEPRPRAQPRPPDRPRLGKRHLHHRTRRRCPHCQSAAQDRAWRGRTPAHRCRERDGVQIR